LFKQTKTFFDNWINSLIGFSLQQIFLVFTLTLFNTFLYLIIKLNLGYTVCWDNVWQIPIGKQMITLFSFWTPQDSPSIINSSVEVNMIGASMPSLPKVLSLWTVCILMRTFVSSITDLAATLSGGMSATDLGSTLSSGVTKIIEAKKQGLGELYKKSGLNLVARADQKLFDSGQLAKNERKQVKRW
jgi:type IV secretory pathway VirB6-like protein